MCQEILQHVSCLCLVPCASNTVCALLCLPCTVGTIVGYAHMGILFEQHAQCAYLWMYISRVTGFAECTYIPVPAHLQGHAFVLEAQSQVVSVAKCMCVSAGACSGWPRARGVPCPASCWSRRFPEHCTSCPSPLATPLTTMRST